MTDAGTTGDRRDPAERRPMSIDEIRARYAAYAHWVDRIEPIERLLTGRYRRRLFGRVQGRVLDVACGAGTNARYLPASTAYFGIDISPAMLAMTRRRLERLDRPGTCYEMDAQHLAFADDTFDTVISSLSTCTVPDPVTALREMGRVCGPDGRILLLEHGRSDVGVIARLQDAGGDAYYAKVGCRWTQEPLELVSLAGLAVAGASSHLLGILTMIDARPGGR